MRCEANYSKASLMEKARAFDPFGYAGLPPLGEIRMTLAGEIKMRGCVKIGAASFS